MRTNIELPNELYRALKARAALSGVTMRDLVRRYLEQRLKQPGVPSDTRPGQRQPPPVVIAPQGVPTPALSRADWCSSTMFSLGIEARTSFFQQDTGGCADGNDQSRSRG